MDAVSTVQALRNEGCLGRTAIMHAALRGDLELFNVVLSEMKSRLKKEEVKCRSETGRLVDRVNFLEGTSRQMRSINYNVSSVLLESRSFIQLFPIMRIRCYFCFMMRHFLCS